MTKPKRIFIVGHSGAGKGFLGQALAESLGWQFIDADFGLAASIGRSTTEILGKQGEESFNFCLKSILENLMTKENIVVATDDSIVVTAKNRQLLSSEFTVYLRVSTAVQLERISYNRPLLTVTNYETFLDKLHQERDGLYNEVSSFSLSSDSGAIEEHVSSVIKALEK